MRRVKTEGACRDVTGTLQWLHRYSDRSGPVRGGEFHAVDAALLAILVRIYC